jgi:N-acetylglucosamine kinase-like BadF-type ATPase
MLFLGIDGGQSSTTALIADEEGRVLGWGDAGPCNHVSGPEAALRFTNAISKCISEACSRASLDPEIVEFESVCCGMSGGAADKSGLLRSIIRCSLLTVVDDSVIALAGATAGGSGIVVIAGTGSIALGRRGSQPPARAGGWGYIFGDEGSAFDIVRQAIRAALRFEEGWGPPTSLRRMLLSETGCYTLNDLLHMFYSPKWPRARIAALAPLVDAECAGGDPLARAIMEQAAQILATNAASVRAQLRGDQVVLPVSPVGGVFRSETLHARFRLLVELTDGCSYRLAFFGPAAGALLEAFCAVNRDVVLSGVPTIK